MVQAIAAPSRCLVVEGEAVIGLFLEDGLREAGFEARWVPSVQGAFDLLASAPFDVALLDAAMRSGTRGPLAGELSRLRIPFVVYSAQPRDRDLVEARDAPWLEKPADTEALAAALAAVMGPPCGVPRTVTGSPARAVAVAVGSAAPT